MPVQMEQIVAHLIEHEFKYFIDPTHQIVIVPFPVDGSLLNVTVAIDEGGELLRCSIPYFLCAKNAVNRESLLGELLSLNYNLKIAKLGLDPSDNEIRVEATVSIEDGVVTDKQIARALGAVFHVMSEYHKPLMELINNGVSVKEQQNDVVRRLLEGFDPPPGDAVSDVEDLRGEAELFDHDEISDDDQAVDDDGV